LSLLQCLDEGEQKLLLFELYTHTILTVITFHAVYIWYEFIPNSGMRENLCQHIV